VAVLLGLLAWQLPSTAEIASSFAKTEGVTRKTAGQVRLVREQVHGLRRPELRELAERLQAQTRTVTATLRSQSVDYETLETMRNALGEVAVGLDGLAATFDPARVGKLADGLGETASFLDEKVVPAAAKAADHLDQVTASLREDARRLGNVLRETPIDLKAAEQIRDSLVRFGAELEGMRKALPGERLRAIREGFDGLEDTLNTAASQVESVAGLTYPSVKFNGLKAEVMHRKFWPDGERIAQGMRKAAAGVTAAGTEMDGLAETLPKLRAALDESRKVIEKTQEALTAALRQRDKIEPLLKDAPAHAARFADDLPRLAGDLARMLRDARRLNEVADALRQAQKGIQTVVDRWPELRLTLTRSAKLLKVTRDQLTQVLDHRQNYEAARQQSMLLGESFATMLPLFTDQLDGELQDQEQALTELSHSIDDVGDTLPAFAQTTAHMLQLGRWLLWLLAGMALAHGLATWSAGRGART
jgi:flagellar biosynthesis chaperone FliJ